MAAYAALVSLVNIIERIQRHTRFPIHLDQKQMHSLHDKVHFLIGLLESDSHGNGAEAKDLEAQTADLAYEAEDIIESHVVDTIKAVTSTGQTKKITVLSCLAGIAGLEILIEKMDYIRDEFMRIKSTSLHDHHHTYSSSTYIPFGKNTMVGFDDERVRLVELLTGHHSGRQIIPVVGMGGIGKTTLAKNVYEFPVFARHFDTRAWVTISQEYAAKSILIGLLRQVKDGYVHNLDQMNEEQLGDRLYKSLYQMRYLVVLDDIWSIEAWQIVRMYFPDNDNGSRIIVTTRLTSVASHLNTDSLVMNLLDENKSWNLLCQTVFFQDGCPLELEGVGRTIATNCKGLPLSIVVIGGLLAKSEREKEYWEYVAMDTNSVISVEGDEHCLKILSLSYHSLPVHLKPCFLYMGIFPEDKEIRVSWLINLWIAEGFLKPSSFEDLELAGKEYLNDLISRNLISVHKRGSDGNIRLCNIHDLVRDLSLKEAHKEKFLYVSTMNKHSGGEATCYQRRICVPWSSSKEKHLSPVLNNVKLESMVRSLISGSDELLPLQNFRLLRVLKAADKYSKIVEEERKDKYLLDEICDLVNIRYIAIQVLENSLLPSSLWLSWNLQTLNVHGISSRFTIPLEIWEMAELRHIEVFSSVTLLNPPCHQDIRRCYSVSLVNLLRAIGISNFRCSNEVVKKTPNVKKLRIFYVSEMGYDQYYLQNLILLEKLESLRCDFHGGQTDVPSNLAFPNSLKKLNLSGCKFHWDDMRKIGSLPQLEVLKLLASSFTGPKWRPVEGEFQRLKYLQLSSLYNLEYWMVDSTHFPNLEYLVLRSLHKLVEIPSDIGEIPTLQLIRIDLCSDSVILSAKELLQEQEELGNVGLQVQVFCQKKAKLEILASDNFQVRTFMKGNAFSSPFLPFL